MTGEQIILCDAKSWERFAHIKISVDRSGPTRKSNRVK